MRGAGDLRPRTETNLGERRMGFMILRNWFLGHIGAEATGLSQHG